MRFDGHVMVGLAESTMLMAIVQEDCLLARSVATQFTFVVVETLKRLEFESGQETLAIPEASVAVTFARKLTVTSGRLSVGAVVYEMAEGQVMTGGAAS